MDKLRLFDCHTCCVCVCNEHRQYHSVITIVAYLKQDAPQYQVWVQLLRLTGHVAKKPHRACGEKTTQPHDLADIFCHVHWLKHRETHMYVVKEGIFTLLKRSPNMLTLPTITHKSLIILHCFGNLSVHPD